MVLSCLPHMTYLYSPRSAGQWAKLCQIQGPLGHLRRPQFLGLVQIRHVRPERKSHTYSYLRPPLSLRCRQKGHFLAGLNNEINYTLFQNSIYFIKNGLHIFNITVGNRMKYYIKGFILKRQSFCHIAFNRFNSIAFSFRN